MATDPCRLISRAIAPHDTMSFFPDAPVPGSAWEVRALRLGDVSRNGWWWPASIGPRVARELRDTPVGLHLVEGRLGHREDTGGVDLAGISGWVESTWSTSDAVFAVVRLLESAVVARRGNGGDGARWPALVARALPRRACGL
jgi:hypothetical protein